MTLPPIAGGSTEDGGSISSSGGNGRSFCLPSGFLLPPPADRYAMCRRGFSRRITCIGWRRGIKIPVSRRIKNPVSNTLIKDETTQLLAEGPVDVCFLHEEFDDQEPPHPEFLESQIYFGNVPPAWLMPDPYLEWLILGNIIESPKWLQGG